MTNLCLLVVPGPETGGCRRAVFRKGIDMKTDLVVLATDINRHHQEAQKAAESALQHARAAGELLLQAKERCQHGDWGKWLKENFNGSDRTAQRYMTFAKRWPELEAKTTRVADLPIREAARLLTDSNVVDLGVEIHPALSIIPDFDGPGYEAFKADIAESGQLVPIAFFKGQLLDGRARLRACRELGIKPKTIDLDEDIDPISYVLSMNVCRTHRPQDDLLDDMGIE